MNPIPILFALGAVLLVTPAAAAVRDCRKAAKCRERALVTLQSALDATSDVRVAEFSDTVLGTVVLSCHGGGKRNLSCSATNSTGALELTSTKLDRTSGAEHVTIGVRSKTTTIWVEAFW